jgi:hypothetical protein
MWKTGYGESERREEAGDSTQPSPQTKNGYAAVRNRIKNQNV